MKKAKKIKVYSTSTCPYCHMAKDFLNKKGVKFEDIDVGESHEVAHEMIKKSGQMGVPVIEIDGKIIIGFDKEKIEELLE
jgi:glutaredoxin-like YruB-family protein